jgi:hypothetical protein
MKRMKEADLKALFAFVANETEYDLLQIQPKDFNELTVCLALTLDGGQHTWDVLIISARKKSQNIDQAFILKVILLIISLLLHEGWPFEPSCCLHKAFILCHKLSPRHLTFITMPFTIKSKPLLM